MSELGGSDGRERDGERERREHTSSIWHSHTNISIYQYLSLGRDNCFFCSIDIITGGESATAGRETGAG